MRTREETIEARKKQKNKYDFVCLSSRRSLCFLARLITFRARAPPTRAAVAGAAGYVSHFSRFLSITAEVFQQFQYCNKIC